MALQVTFDASNFHKGANQKDVLVTTGAFAGVNSDASPNWLNRKVKVEVIAVSGLSLELIQK
jgi:hypothetical protein